MMPLKTIQANNKGMQGNELTIKLCTIANLLLLLYSGTPIRYIDIQKMLLESGINDLDFGVHKYLGKERLGNMEFVSYTMSYNYIPINYIIIEVGWWSSQPTV